MSAPSFVPSSASRCRLLADSRTKLSSQMGIILITLSLSAHVFTSIDPCAAGTISYLFRYRRILAERLNTSRRQFEPQSSRSTLHDQELFFAPWKPYNLQHDPIPQQPQTASISSSGLKEKKKKWNFNISSKQKTSFQKKKPLFQSKGQDLPTRLKTSLKLMVWHARWEGREIHWIYSFRGWGAQ